ncbi:MAG: tRNA (N6-isopentenyl adenosine(37)-C2)-methylthiotransferase MiaB [Planctomycetota bacterium]|nr:tRNA (N6-isopentenyl adenosine(37)-C2)-methylthiotransferase MiaB [Planctomycetota bacterium]
MTYHNSKRVFIQTFGCQMNKLDSELIAGSLTSAGFQLVSSEAEADVILVNTCSVRKHAEDRVYSRVGNLKTLHNRKPHPCSERSEPVIIGIIGCMAQKDKADIIKRLPFVSLVCGPHRYQSIVGYIEKLLSQKADKIVCADEEGLLITEKYEHTSFISDKKHSYVQIMRGCDNSCSYCIVPYVRGKEISRSPQEILQEIDSLLEHGIREITLLGQNITSYGKSLDNKVTLSYLLRELQRSTLHARSLSHWDYTLSFLTSHPANVTDELLETMRELPEIKRILHMPAQSGSDRILNLMRRGYTAQTYLEIVRKAKHLMPDIEIISDFIVGFPTETDEDFQKTVQLVKEAKFNKIYVFKYSPRTGTEADKLPDDVPMGVKKERNNYLLAVRKSNTNFIPKVFGINLWDECHE